MIAIDSTFLSIRLFIILFPIVLLLTVFTPVSIRYIIANRWSFVPLYYVDHTGADSLSRALLIYTPVPLDVLSPTCTKSGVSGKYFLGYRSVSSLTGVFQWFIIIANTYGRKVSVIIIRSFADRWVLLHYAASQYVINRHYTNYC